MSPSPIFAVRLCTRVGEQRQRIPTCFLVCNFLFCNSTIKTAMFQQMLSQICSCGSVVRAVRFLSERLLVLIQTARFCPSGTSAPTWAAGRQPPPARTGQGGGPPGRAPAVGGQQPARRSGRVGGPPAASASVRPRAVTVIMLQIPY